MFKSNMDNKGFTDKKVYIQTPNDIDHSEKPLKSEPIVSNRVDINVLKSKLKETENKEFRKNVIIFVSFLVAIGTLGIYLSV